MKKFTWLYNYTNNCTNFGCDEANNNTQGYWTSTPVTGETNYVWMISCDGRLLFNSAAATLFGVRHVIEIKASDL